MYTGKKSNLAHVDVWGGGGVLEVTNVGGFLLVMYAGHNQ